MTDKFKAVSLNISMNVVLNFLSSRKSGFIKQIVHDFHIIVVVCYSLSLTSSGYSEFSLALKLLSHAALVVWTSAACSSTADVTGLWTSGQWIWFLDYLIITCKEFYCHWLSLMDIQAVSYSQATSNGTNYYHHHVPCQLA